MDRPGRTSRRTTRVLLPLALVLLLAGAAFSLYSRAAYGVWMPGSQPPPRLTLCGRTYDRAADVRITHPTPDRISTVVGTYPPLVGRPVRSITGCEGNVPAGVFLTYEGGYVGYGLSGSP